MNFFKGQERRMAATNFTFQYWGLTAFTKKQFIKNIIDLFQKWISSSVFIVKLHLSAVIHFLVSTEGYWAQYNCLVIILECF